MSLRRSATTASAWSLQRGFSSPGSRLTWESVGPISHQQALHAFGALLSQRVVVLGLPRSSQLP